MGRFRDVRKAREWRERLDRVAESRLTVGRFCELERVSVHSFYYWRNRVDADRPMATSGDVTASRVGDVTASRAGESAGPSGNSAAMKFGESTVTKVRRSTGRSGGSAEPVGESVDGSGGGSIGPGSAFADVRIVAGSEIRIEFPGGTCVRIAGGDLREAIHAAAMADAGIGESRDRIERGAAC